jgi:hypothetical protein
VVRPLVSIFECPSLPFLKAGAFYVEFVTRINS